MVSAPTGRRQALIEESGTPAGTETEALTESCFLASLLSVTLLALFYYSELPVDLKCSPSPAPLSPFPWPEAGAFGMGVLKCLQGGVKENRNPHVPTILLQEMKRESQDCLETRSEFVLLCHLHDHLLPN